MAQNKKQKVDFSTALKEASTKLMPKKEESKAKEFVIADIGGQPTKLFRGDSSDKEWEATKERAERQNATAEQPSAGPGTSVLGNVAEMATGATPSESVNPSVEGFKDFISSIANSPPLAAANRILTPIAVKEGAAMSALDPGVDAEAAQRDAMLQETAPPVMAPPVAAAPEVVPPVPEVGMANAPVEQPMTAFESAQMMAVPPVFYNM